MSILVTYSTARHRKCYGTQKLAGADSGWWSERREQRIAPAREQLLRHEMPDRRRERHAGMHHGDVQPGMVVGSADRRKAAGRGGPIADGVKVQLEIVAALQHGL